MKYSVLVGKTSKTAPHDADSVNARLLVQAGFVRQEMAGVYAWLPLGLRVLHKIEAIIREEMNVLGAQEVLLPALQAKEHWEESGRWNDVDVLFKIPSQTGKEYGLGPTHEEVVTPLLKEFIRSYRDLPVAVYQIQTKFRDELRAKSGVLRGREFGMKDLYSFHANQEDLEAFYEKALQAYIRVFERIGLHVKVVEASGGSFTKKLSHEFQVLTSAGEDKILTSPSWIYGQNSEVATLKEGDPCPTHPEETLAWEKGVEVGNIFNLGTRFTESFDVAFTSESGERQRVVMGCYGIGTTRLVGTVVEACHDERGIVWPKSVAPFAVHLVSLYPKDQDVITQVDMASKELHDALIAQGFDVLWDDRVGVSPGEKFADVDLIGIPVRLVVSQRSLSEGAVEWKDRAGDQGPVLVPVAEAVERLIQYYR